MNTYLDFPLNQTWKSLNISSCRWLVSPAEQAYTYQDWIGDPEEDIVSYEASQLPSPDPLPEIDPDEFEIEYYWFLS